AVSFGVPVGQVKFQTRVKLPEKTVNNSHSSSTIHIIIAIDKYFFLISDGFFNPGNGFIHVFHKKGIVKRRQIGTKKAPRIVKVVDAPFYQQLSQYPVNTKRFT